MTTAPEADQDYGAAENPRGLEFSVGADGSPILNAIEADSFPEQSQQAIEGLLWLGYLSEKFSLFGHTFAIKTLTRGDRLAVSQITKEWEQTLGMSDAYETATVAAALVEYDDYPIMELSRNAPRMEQIRSTFKVVQEWYDPVVTELYARVTLLNQKQAAAFLALQSK